jgi:2-methylcitrate dehydratase PrpD
LAASLSRRSTDRVTEFIADFRLSAVTDAAKETSSRVIADCLGVMVAGAQSPASRHVTRFASAFSGQPSAPILGAGASAPIQLAALANGTSAHALDFDDDEPAVFIGHPTSPVLVSLVSLAHMRPVTGADVLAAFLVGTDVQSALARVVNPKHYLAGWHATSTLGVIGATAAGAKLLGLDRTKSAYALGIAASCVSGLKVNFGTMTKPLHVGRAGEAAVTAVLLAESGFTAAEAVLDGPLGLIEVLGADEVGPADRFSDLGERHAVLDPGVAIKRYPCCSSTHPALDAYLDLREEFGIAAADIERIRCELAPPAADILIYAKPSSPLEGKFSMAYCLAVAAVRGAVTQDDFSEQALEDSQVMSLIDSIDVEYTDSLNQPDIWVSTAARVVVSLRDGQKVERVAWEPKGSARNPLSEAELWAKFRGCTTSLVTEEAAKRTFQRLLALEAEDDFATLLLPLCPTGCGNVKQLSHEVTRS